MSAPTYTSGSLFAEEYEREEQLSSMPLDDHRQYVIVYEFFRVVKKKKKKKTTTNKQPCSQRSNRIRQLNQSST